MTDLRWRAVDVNRPVTPSSPLDAALARAITHRYRGFTSPLACVPMSAIPACKARSTSPG
ncbi:MAG UNVERIFIED_CONTAM: hypothetical protein LVR18_22340 [Planctomycetaceae bacterium]